MKCKPDHTPKPRPIYNATDALEIATRLSAGEPMAVICRDEFMPCVTTVWTWQKDHPEFAESIARAREIGFDVIATDCLSIADGKDKPTPEDLAEFAETGQIIVRDHNRDRLRIDTRLKLLAKWDPKRYGDKTTTELTGPNGGPIQTEATDQLAALPKDRRDAIRAAIKAAMGEG
jgi:hypothetical protein